MTDDYRFFLKIPMYHPTPFLLCPSKGNGDSSLLLSQWVGISIVECCVLVPENILACGSVGDKVENSEQNSSCVALQNEACTAMLGKFPYCIATLSVPMTTYQVLLRASWGQEWGLLILYHHIYSNCSIHIYWMDESLILKIQYMFWELKVVQDYLGL